MNYNHRAAVIPEKELLLNLWNVVSRLSPLNRERLLYYGTGMADAQIPPELTESQANQDNTQSA